MSSAFQIRINWIEFEFLGCKKYGLIDIISPNILNQKNKGLDQPTAAMVLSPASCFSRRQARPPPTWRGSSTSSCRPRSAAAAAAPRSGDTARLAMGTSGMFSFHTSCVIIFCLDIGVSILLLPRANLPENATRLAYFPQKPGNCCKLGNCYLVPSTWDLKLETEH